MVGFLSYRRGWKQAQRAFTVVELLVSVAIIGLLITLLLPAVQAARESARQIECKNNLKQLALASYGHHDVHGHFPSGGWGWYWVGDADRGFGKDQPGGWIYNLLPYFEQYSLYDQASDGAPYKLSRQQRLGASMIVQTPLTVINCPSRRPNRQYPLTSNESGAAGFFNSLTPKAAGRSDYAANSGHVYNEWPNRLIGRGPRNYRDADTWTANRYWGGQQSAFFRNVPNAASMSGLSYERSEVSARQVSDGLSHTYLVGERHVPSDSYHSGSHSGDNETWCTGFNNDNYRKTGRLVDHKIVECAPIPDTARGFPVAWGRFGSAHPSLWHSSFCDGSVRAMSYELDWRTHRDLGNRRDN